MVHMTFCGKCGYNNPEDRELCVNCGASLSATVGDSTPIDLRKPAQEVERIGSYDPKRNYPAPAMQPVGVNQPYGRMAQPPAPNQPMPPAQPPMMPPMAPPVNNFAVNYNHKGRGFAILLSLSALAVTIVALFGIPLDFESFNNTFLRIGMSVSDKPILLMTFITLAVGIVALVEPIVCLVSGGCLIGLAVITYTDSAIAFFGTAELVVFILIALDIMALGIISVVFMKKFVNNNIKGVNSLKACYLTWVGIPHQ